jgi:hypothetical protein
MPYISNQPPNRRKFVKSDHPVCKAHSTFFPKHFANRFSGRVARWFVFKPKIPNLVIFGGPQNGNYWNILWSFGIFYGHLVYFIAIW